MKYLIFDIECRSYYTKPYILKFSTYKDALKLSLISAKNDILYLKPNIGCSLEIKVLEDV